VREDEKEWMLGAELESFVHHTHTFFSFLFFFSKEIIVMQGLLQNINKGFFFFFSKSIGI